MPKPTGCLGHRLLVTQVSGPAHRPRSCETPLEAVTWAWVKGTLPTGDEGRSGEELVKRSFRRRILLTLVAVFVTGAMIAAGSVATWLLSRGESWRESAQRRRWEDFNHAGMVAMANSRIADAEGFFVAALAEAEKVSPANDMLLATTENLVSLYTPTSQYSQSERWLLKQLDLQQKLLSADDPEIAMTYWWLADLCSWFPDKDTERVALLEKAIAIWEAGGNVSNQRYAFCLEEVGMFYCFPPNRDRERAASLLRKAIPVLRRLGGYDEDSMRFLEWNLHLIEQEPIQEARAAAKEEELRLLSRVAMQERELGEEHPEVGRMYQTLGDTAWHIQGGMLYYQKAKAIYEKQNMKQTQEDNA